MVLTRSNINSLYFALLITRVDHAGLKDRELSVFLAPPLSVADLLIRAEPESEYIGYSSIRDYFLMNLEEATISLFNHESNPTAGHPD